MEPITFAPVYLEHVWGGRTLECVYARTLPTPDRVYGEAWDIVDRDPEQSVVEDGELAGLSLHELWTERREAVFGAGFENTPRFPLLFKVLDARDDLSIQVHPPAEVIARLGGESKTEMWYIADCVPGANLYVGLKAGVTRAGFEAAIRNGTVAACVHVLTPKPGESIFIHRGRLHAIGAGFLIHEIQQNSDTTYRVFDWNRPGLDGRPRQLHIDASLASIDFDDCEPTMDRPRGDTLADCPYFKTTRQVLAVGDSIGNPDAGRFSILVVVNGCLQSAAGRQFGIGQSLLLPRAASPVSAQQNTTVLQVTLPVRERMRGVDSDPWCA
ncbi:MAG: type I phosphomannose isomerase catalytic subunit [Verrucomicrobiota bacterium]